MSSRRQIQDLYEIQGPTVTLNPNVAPSGFAFGGVLKPSWHSQDRKPQPLTARCYSFALMALRLHSGYIGRDFLIFLEQDIGQKAMYTVHMLENTVL
jgi:hypothetical protein